MTYFAGADVESMNVEADDEQGHDTQDDVDQNENDDDDDDDEDEDDEDG